MAILDSLYRRNAAQWPQYYAILEQQLGATATLLDFGNQSAAGKVNAATWTGHRFSASGVAPVWTPSEALSAFDTPFDLTNPDNYLGYAPILTLNGTDEEADTPDIAFFSRDDASAEKMSMGGWFNFASFAGEMEILAKIDETTGTTVREWHYRVTGSKMDLRLVDESANVSATRPSSTTLVVSRWYFVVVTYAGTGGATAANGINHYINGAVDNGAASNNGSYVAMENLAVVPSFGYMVTSGGTKDRFLNGKALGGPWSPFFCQAELTAAQVKNIYERLRLGLGV